MNTKTTILLFLTTICLLGHSQGAILSSYSLGTCVPDGVVNVMNQNTYIVCCENETNHIVLSLAADRKTLSESSRLAID